MKDVTVIGGSGFLGSEVSKELIKKNYQVKIFDKKKPKFSHKNLKYINGDILNKNELEKVIKNSLYVFNFAGIADLDYGVSQPTKSIEQNVLATVNMLAFCKKYRVNRFIFASTIYVYSSKGGFYRCSKQAAENYIEEYQKKFSEQPSFLHKFPYLHLSSSSRNFLCLISKLTQHQLRHQTT